MITYSDPEYLDTKELVANNSPLIKPFDEIANWVEEKYKVRVLNVVYDKIEPDNRPRLQVILEFRYEANLFKQGEYGNYNPTKQKAVKDKFIETVRGDLFKKYSHEGLFVVFSAFEPIAREEAINAVPIADIEKLKDDLNFSDLWEIRPAFGGVTFFFYTNKQLANNKTEEFKNLCINAFVDIVKKFDRFNYVSAKTLPVFFDTKENFDRNYGSRWHAYYR